MASIDKAGAGSSAVTASSSESGGNKVWMSLPVLTFQISTDPLALPTNILFKYVGRLHIPPLSLAPAPVFLG